MMILQSIAAVIAGYIVMAAIVIACGAVLRSVAPGAVATEGAAAGSYVVLNLVYSCLAAIAGGYVAAWIGARNPVAHASALAVLAFVLALVSAKQYAGVQPRWYQMTLAVLAPIGILCGGFLRSRT